MMVMPFLHLVGDKETRLKLCDDAKQGTGDLYRALHSLASNRVKHNDIAWRHIGYLLRDREHQKSRAWRTKKADVEMDRQLMFCDLESVEHLADEEQTQWVYEQIDILRERVTGAATAAPESALHVALGSCASKVGA